MVGASGIVLYKILKTCEEVPNAVEEVEEGVVPCTHPLGGLTVAKYLSRLPR